MLPEFLYSAGNSMQDISRDDFTLLNGGNGEKDNCGYNLRVHATGSPLTNIIAAPSPSPISATTTSGPTARSLLYDSPNNGGIKLEDNNNTVDLFPTHPTTWQQHPMNSHEHAHHRHQHRSILNTGTNKLLLQGSDDPLISRGANSVTDDDPPAEYNTLIAAVQNGTHHQNPKQNATRQHQQETSQQQHHHSNQLQTPKQQQQTQQPQQRQLNGCSSLTKQQLKVKASLMSSQNQNHGGLANTTTTTSQPKPTRTPKPKKKSAIKLRFHHQALPAEYLSHYEATQGQNVAKLPHKKEVVPVKLAQAAKLLPPKSAHENVRSWLQKIAEIQRSSQQPHQQTQDINNNNQPPQAKCAANERTNSPILKKLSPTVYHPMPENDLNHHVPVGLQTTNSELPNSSQQHKKIVKYSDLPYMGEMTLDNSKPRRGRKPKKADICHLIYKNYGTIFPGTPRSKLHKTARIDLAFDATKTTQHENTTAVDAFDEPLNLCLRDHQSADSYSISSAEEDDEQESRSTSNCPTPVATASDVANDTFLAANLKLSMSTPVDPLVTLVTPHPESTNMETNTTIRVTKVNESAATIPAKVMLHPMSLYYQKLIESGTLIARNGGKSLSLPVETIQQNNQLALKIPIPSGLFLTPKQEKSSPPVPPPNSTTLEYPEPLSTPSSIKSENSVATATTTSSANFQQQQQQQQLPPKRKRSAIFIPPMPAENPNNPPSEVSICKFKFTGGAKPMLQEKKMLSVDSDGNYRYYSGTGDKSMRGYEFFPRESLQQSGVVPGVNCAGAFLNATGERILMDIPPPSAELSNELLQIPDSPTSNLLLPAVGIAIPIGPFTSKNITRCISSPDPNGSSPGSQQQQKQIQRSGLRNTNVKSCGNEPHVHRPQSVALSQRSSERKKKSRRSAQREKLEKTFKEKGFLIQTQQLESAEGATYCKFRQLKKFTRYLFRNWKDYLPDELQQANEAAAAAAAAVVLNSDVKQCVSANSNTGTGPTSPESSIDSILASHGFSSLNERLMEDNHTNRYRTTCISTNTRVALDRVQNAVVENTS